MQACASVVSTHSLCTEYSIPHKLVEMGANADAMFALLLLCLDLLFAVWLVCGLFVCVCVCGCLLYIVFIFCFYLGWHNTVCCHFATRSNRRRREEDPVRLCKIHRLKSYPYTFKLSMRYFPVQPT